ncbi:hypothetical protein ACQKM9_10135 [Viridibacillus sp. NPDC093762]
MSNLNNLTEFEELNIEFQRKVSVKWNKRLDQLVTRSLNERSAVYAK